MSGKVGEMEGMSLNSFEWNRKCYLIDYVLGQVLSNNVTLFVHGVQ